MKRLLLLGTIVLLSTLAQAKTVELKSDAADSFIARHFPNAAIPGPVEGAFKYVRHGRITRGHAKCFVPAMGERSDGVVSSCKVAY
jgi:hypothetical protein